MCDPEIPSSDRPSPTLDAMIRLARLQAPQHVAVAGPAGLPATLGLMRKGFAHVACMCDRCGGEAGESDALLLTGPLDGGELAALLTRSAGLLRDRAVVVAHESSVDADGALFRALDACGLEAEWVVHDMARACLAAFGVRRKAACAAASAPLALAA